MKTQDGVSAVPSSGKAVLKTWKNVLCFHDPIVDFRKFPQYYEVRRGEKCPLTHDLSIPFCVILGIKTLFRTKLCDSLWQMLTKSLEFPANDQKCFVPVTAFFLN